MILVDSSVLIGYFKGTKSDAPHKLDSFIENEIVDFDQSRIQRYIFPDNRILLYDDIQSDCVIIQTDQLCTFSTLME